MGKVFIPALKSINGGIVRIFYRRAVVVFGKRSVFDADSYRKSGALEGHGVHDGRPDYFEYGILRDRLGKGPVPCIYYVRGAVGISFTGYSALFVVVKDYISVFDLGGVQQSVFVHEFYGIRFHLPDGGSRDIVVYLYGVARLEDFIAHLPAFESIAVYGVLRLRQGKVRPLPEFFRPYEFAVLVERNGKILFIASG